MNLITQAREQLAAAIEDLLPGRVAATPRTDDVGTSLWIDAPTLTPDRVPGVRSWTVEFPVWAVFDGADTAQLAAAEDLTAKLIDACDRIKHCWPTGSRPVDTSDGNRAVVTTVRMLYAARGLSLPDAPGESPIPPDPIVEE